MCRCEAVLYVQKRKELRTAALYLQIPKELSKSWSPQAGVTARIYNHPSAMLLYDYRKVKYKMRTRA